MPYDITAPSSASKPLLTRCPMILGQNPKYSLKGIVKRDSGIRHCALDIRRIASAVFLWTCYSRCIVIDILCWTSRLRRIVEDWRSVLLNTFQALTPSCEYWNDRGNLISITGDIEIREEAWKQKENTNLTISNLLLRRLMMNYYTIKLNTN